VQCASELAVAHTPNWKSCGGLEAARPVRAEAVLPVSTTVKPAADPGVPPSDAFVRGT
jgi:hypothetical protein